MALEGITENDEVRWVPYSDLWLDPANPRLAGIRLTIENQLEILTWLWKTKNVRELVDSIAANGYWRHEELFVAEEDDRLVVMEGNRRLAAVRLLMEPEIREEVGARNVPEIAESVRESIERLPVIISPRDEAWQYIGFKHVNGPQVWDSIAKAEYAYRVHHRLNVPLDQIARTIGDQHDTVARMLRGYHVLKQAQDNELFDRENSVQKRFPFSHLWTAIGYTNVMEYLGVDRERLSQENPIPEERLEHLSRFLTWLYGDEADGITPLVRRQNPDLRRLAEALGSEEGLRILESGLPLDSAVEAARGDATLFKTALTRSEDHLRSAMRYVATGYQGEDDLLQTAADIRALAQTLFRSMKDFHSVDDATDEG